MTGVAEDETMDYLMAKIPGIKFAFVFFMVASSWTLLSILSAVVSDVMISTQVRQEAEFKIVSADDDWVAEVEELRQFFQDMAAEEKHDQKTIDKKEIETYAGDMGSRERRDIAMRCRVPVSDVIKTWEIMKSELDEDSEVNTEEFVKCMARVSKSVIEKSLIHVNLDISKIQDNLGCSDLAEQKSDCNLDIPKIQGNLGCSDLAEQKSDWENKHLQKLQMQNEKMAKVVKLLDEASAQEEREKDELDRIFQLLKRFEEKQEATDSCVRRLEKNLFTLAERTESAMSRLQEKVIALDRNQEATRGVLNAMFSQKGSGPPPGQGNVFVELSLLSTADGGSDGAAIA